jgi:hypothetical protein
MKCPKVQTQYDDPMKLFLSKRERELLYAPPAVTSTQIVCGDCSHIGNDYPKRPIRTRLRVDGRCDRCGGRSYALASIVFARRALQIRDRIAETEEANDLERLYSREIPQ